jgi:ectoine hydroxylase-related dioxygenase (phytanoyl-CoA dioxygenase family)
MSFAERPDAADLLAAYRDDGAVVVRRAFTEAQIEWAQAAIDANLEALSPRALRASSDDDGAFIEDFCNWNRFAPMERFVREAPGAEIAAALTGSTRIRLYHDHVLVKEPGTRQATPWHQDQPYYNVDGFQNASMWLPVDPVPVESSLRVVAGTHRGPWYLPRTFLDEQAKWFPAGSLAESPDFDADLTDDPNAWRVLAWELEPGDAVFFHMAAVHGAGGVTGSGRRRVLSLRFLGDDMVHAPRPWTTSPPFPGLGDVLPAGAEMDHPLFPVLWERDADDSSGYVANQASPPPSAT